MFDTIILVTDSVEESALTAALKRHNPNLAICPANTLEELEAIDPRRLRRARLIGFASPIIVPARILRRLGYGAYNFHPGPPHYPGWAPSQFAVYEHNTRFGVTAHVMLEKVDSGPIVAIDLFDVPATIAAVALEEMAYARMARMFFELAKPLATSAKPLQALPIQWSGRKNTRRHCAELCDIRTEISGDELERRMAAFGDGRLGVTPTINLHGRSFRCADAPAAVEAEAANAASPVNAAPPANAASPIGPVIAAKVAGPITADSIVVEQQAASAVPA